MVDIHGRVDARFDAVREAFAANFELHGDVGAPCCVYIDGRPVVDLWGGWADPAAQRPWNERTVQLVFSATKGVSATCVNLKFDPTGDERTRGLVTAVYGSL